MDDDGQIWQVVVEEKFQNKGIATSAYLELFQQVPSAYQKQENSTDKSWYVYNKAKKIFNNVSQNPFEDKWDLSKAEDSADSHESVNEGAQLTGVFANNMKVLSILAKANDGESHIGKNYVVNWMTKGVNFVLNKIRDENLTGTSLTWQTLDTLVNLAIDNVKDQALNKFRINSKNANIVSVLFGLGIPITDFALLSGTSI